MSGAPAELPEGWERVKLGEICTFVRGVTFSGADSVAIEQEGYLPILRAGNIQSKLDTNNDLLWIPRGMVSEEQILCLNDIAVCLSSGSPKVVGKSAQLKTAFDGSVGAFCGIIRPKLPEYAELVPYWLKSDDFIKWRDSQSRGTNIQNLRFAEFEHLQIPLPPESELEQVVFSIQKQMAEVDKARAATEAQLEAAEVLSGAYLQEVFENGAWQAQELGAVAEVKGGIQKSQKRKPVKFHRPFLTVRNVQRGYLDLSNVERFEVTPVELEKLRLVSDDLLIVEGNGSLDHIGRNALFNDDGQEWIHQNHVIRVRLDQGLANPKFISWFLNSPQGKKQMVEKAETTSGLYTLSVSKVSSLAVPIPSLENQKAAVRKIQRRLASTEELQKSLLHQLEAINALPASLLRQAFSGELTRQPSPEDLRAALTCLAVERLHHRVFFGVVQLMKVLYFAQAHHGVPLGYTMRRHTYGPFDKAVYDLEEEGERQGWFSVDKAVDKQGARYVPGAELDSLAREAEGTLGRWKGELDGLLELAGGFDTTGLEALATLHAAWNDLLLEGCQPTDGEIILEVLECWPGKKEKFQRGELRTYLAYLKATPYIPKGIGQSTRSIPN